MQVATEDRYLCYLLKILILHPLQAYKLHLNSESHAQQVLLDCMSFDSAADTTTTTTTEVLSSKQQYICRTCKIDMETETVTIFASRVREFI